MSNFKFFAAVLALAAIAVGIIACQKDFSSNPPPNKPQDKVTIFIQKVQNAKHEYLINELTDSNLSHYYFDGAQEVSGKIYDYRLELAKINFRYTAYDSKVTIDSTFKTEEGLLVYATEFLSLTTNDPDPDNPDNFIVSEGFYGYKFILIENDGNYTIKKEEALGDDLYFVNLNPIVGQGDFQIDQIEDRNPPSYTYNPTAARDYAYTYWQNYNTAYCDYTYGGGDCTNFLSQCLKSGGWTTNSAWWATGAGCCQNAAGCIIQNCYKCSWTVANTFYNYVTSSGRIQSGCYTDNALIVGDILQLGTAGSVYHSTLVTKKTTNNGTKVYVTYRNASGGYPQKDKLSTTLPDIHYGWKVKASAN